MPTMDNIISNKKSKKYTFYLRRERLQSNIINTYDVHLTRNTTKAIKVNVPIKNLIVLSFSLLTISL